MGKHIGVECRVWLAAAFAISAVLSTPTARASELDQIWRGYEIAPVPLNLKGKDWVLVGLGSYLVNTTGCNDCHTWPKWAEGHNPFMGQPEKINTDRYLAGGRANFGTDTSVNPPVPIVSANITPDNTGKPAGLTLREFLSVMRTGHDPDGSGRLLKVMPWPLYRWKTDRDLAAIYEYLRAIPSCGDEPSPAKACN